MRHFLTAFLVALCLAGPASAHAFLKQADPAVGGTLQTAPSRVTLIFTEQLEPAFSSIQVTGAGNIRFDLGDAHTDPQNAAVFSVGLKPLPPGTYNVVWHATSVDTHRTQGSYSFTVAAPDKLAATDAWARPTPPGLTMGAAYLTIANSSESDDVLIGISTPAAARAEMHVTESQAGVSEMRPLAQLPVKAGATVRFEPFGMHVMLMGLKAPLIDGEHFTLTLHFAKAGDVTALVTVSRIPPEKVEAPTAGGSEMPGMKM